MSQPTSDAPTSALSVVIPSSTALVEMPLSPAPRSPTDAVHRSVWVCGDNECGQLGVAGRDSVHTAEVVHALDNHEAVDISAGAYHTLLLTSRGEVVVMGRDLSATTTPATTPSGAAPVTFMEQLSTLPCVGVAAGEHHSGVLLTSGKMMTWGDVESMPELLGHDIKDERHKRPRHAVLFEGDAVALSCGSNHNLALTLQGDVFTWGLNNHGQCGGSPDVLGKVPKPAHLMPISGIPVLRVACGDHHSALVTKFGALYTFGANRRGQLGHGDDEDRATPLVVESVSHVNIREVACGQAHTVVVTQKGQVYATGSNTFGQLGVGTADARVLRFQHVSGLDGKRVVQIDSGRDHTVALVVERRSSVQREELVTRVYTWGFNASGQLGDGTTSNRNVPGRVMGLESMHVCSIAAGGNHTAMVCVPEAKRTQVCARELSLEPACPLWLTDSVVTLDDAFSYRNEVGGYVSATASVDAGTMSALLDDYAANESSPSLAATRLASIMDNIFSWPGALNASFASSECPSRRACGLDDEVVERVLRRLVEADGDQRGTLVPKMRQCLHGLLTRVARAAAHLRTPTQVRFVVVLLLYADWRTYQADNVGVVTSFGRIVTALSHHGRAVLEQWLSQYSSSAMSAVVDMLQEHISQHINSVGAVDGLVAHCTRVLDLLSAVSTRKGDIVPFTRFHNAVVSEKVALVEDYVRWRKGGSEERSFSFCYHPFIYTTYAKSQLLHLERVILMDTTLLQANTANRILQAAGHQPESLAIKFHVRRDHVIRDAVDNVERYHGRLHQPLMVHFVGEEGVDAGGVKKEFFQLIVESIFDPQFGMFKYDEDLRVYWFHKFLPLEEVVRHLHLIGVLIGLAVYNGVQLDLHFPSVFYKKLLGRTVTLLDLGSIDPELQQGLRMLLDWDGDVEDVFCRTFQVEADGLYGERAQVDLVSNGANVPVTNENRSLFVDKYVDFLLNRHVGSYFDALAAGFYRVMPRNGVLDMFRAEELEVVVCGSRDLNFDDLRDHTLYDGGYTAEHPTIQLFWDVVQSLDVAQKKLLLSFATGSDRVPVGGLKDMRFVIQRHGTRAQLPTSHTCFNVLLLPPYETREELRQKLLIAIENCRGFGLE